MFSASLVNTNAQVGKIFSDSQDERADLYSVLIVNAVAERYNPLPSWPSKDKIELELVDFYAPVYGGNPDAVYVGIDTFIDSFTKALP